MADNDEIKLSNYAKNVLKSEMGRKLFTIAELAKELNVNADALGVKIRRGTFSAGFFLKVLHVLGTKELIIPSEIKEDYDFIKDF